MMSKSKTYLALLAAGMLFFGTTACGDDADETSDNNNTVEESDASHSPNNNKNNGDGNNGAGNNGDGNNGDGNNGDGNNGDGEDYDSLPESWSFDSEYSMRFTEFALDDGAPLHQLNNILDKNITNQDDKYPIVVLLDLQDIDEDAGTLKLRGGAGLKADLECLPEEDDGCDYKWDPGSDDYYSPDATIDASTGALNVGLEALDFVVTFESGDSVLKSAIPISDLTLTGALTPKSERDAAAEEGEVEIQNGVLEGYITKEAADRAEIQLFAGAEPKKLSELLDSTPMTTDLSGDGEKDAWFLTGEFVAAETIIVE